MFKNRKFLISCLIKQGTVPEDIRDAARKILNYTKGMSFDDFLADDKTIDAVVRNFEIIGEAARLVPEILKWSIRNRMARDGMFT